MGEYIQDVWRVTVYVRSVLVPGTVELARFHVCNILTETEMFVAHDEQDDAEGGRRDWEEDPLGFDTNPMLLRPLRHDPCAWRSSERDAGSPCLLVYPVCTASCAPEFIL